MASKRMMHIKLDCWYLNLDAKGLQCVLVTYSITCHFHLISQLTTLTTAHFFEQRIHNPIWQNK